MASIQRKTLSAGNGGWCLFQQFTEPYEPDHLVAYVRAVQRESGRMEIGEIFFASVFVGERGKRRPSTVERLRAFPAADVEAWMNDPEMAKSIGDRMTLPGPLVHEAASYYAITYGQRQRNLTDDQLARQSWIYRMLESQYPDSTEPPALLLTPAHVTWGEPEEPDLRLDVPAEGTRPYPPAFFEQVATVYSAAARAYRDPANKIADANHVNVTTVHRWVKRTRQLGLLGPAQHGKRG